MIAISFALFLAVADVVCRIHDRRMTCWTVSVLWEGDWYRHVAKSLSDGLEWAACYPNDAAVAIERSFHGHHTIEARRIGA